MSVYLHVLGGPVLANFSEWVSTALALLAVLPSAVLIYLVYRFNFLQIGRQKNLVYAVSATFLALLYLSLVRRVGMWLEPVLPPEASASILLFVLVIFIEPMQRVLGRSLRETAQLEMDRVQRSMAEIQQEARQGDVPRLVKFIEQQIQERLELREVRLKLTAAESETGPGMAVGEPRAALAFDPREFRISRGEKVEGILHVEPHGATISGETRAALEFLCEQLPGALDLCRLIEEKLRLETGTGRARTAGAGGSDGGEHFAQSEESPGVDQDDSAGADGKSGAAGVGPRRKQDCAGRDWAALGQAESVAAIQPAGDSGGKHRGHLRCASESSKRS